MPVKIATVEDLNEGHQAALRGFPSRLMQIRQRLQMSQTDLGQLIGAGRGSLANWESGAALPDLATICIIAERLRVSVEWLAFGRANNLGPDALLEERCLNVEILNPAPAEVKEVIFDSQASQRLGLRLHRCMVAWCPYHVEEYGYRSGDMLFIDLEDDYSITPGDYVFFGASQSVQLLRIVNTGVGPRAVRAGHLAVVDESIVGRGAGRVVAQLTCY